MAICLWCSYDLTGLPQRHTCPECGLAYDPNAFAIELKPSIVLTTWMETVGILLLVLAAIHFASSGSFLRCVLALTVAAAVVWMLPGSRRQPYRHVRLIVNRVGLHICPRGAEVRSFRWDEVKDVRESRVTGAVVLETVRGREVQTLPNRPLFRPWPTEDPVQLIRTAMERYRSGASAPDSNPVEKQA